MFIKYFYIVSSSNQSFGACLIKSDRVPIRANYSLQASWKSIENILKTTDLDLKKEED
jgi:hypothetical protein